MEGFVLSEDIGLLVLSVFTAVMLMFVAGALVSGSASGKSIVGMVIAVALISFSFFVFFFGGMNGPLSKVSISETHQEVDKLEPDVQACVLKKIDLESGEVSIISTKLLQLIGSCKNSVSLSQLKEVKAIE